MAECSNRVNEAHLLEFIFVACKIADALYNLEPAAVVRSACGMRQKQEITVLCILYHSVALVVVSIGLPWQDGGQVSFQGVSVGGVHGKVKVVVMRIALVLIFFVPGPLLNAVCCDLFFSLPLRRQIVRCLAL